MFEAGELKMQGGQGTVEIKTENGIQYACKHLLQGQAADSDAVHRFMREIRIAQSINSANVIKVLDYGEDERGHFYTMPVYQMSLSQYIIAEQERLYNNPEIQKNIFLSILLGVDSLHRNGIIHRDLKPDNVLMNGIYDIVICDFGFSKDLESSSSFTSTGLAFGTRNYISPEQMRDSKHVDQRTDIYALGQMLNDLSRRMVGTPPIQIQRIADKATAFNPEERYSSVSEMKQDIVSGYDAWLRINNELSVKQMLEEISARRVDSVGVLSYVNYVVNNRYYECGDADRLLGVLFKEQYEYLESVDQELCLKLFNHIWEDFRNTWNRSFGKIDDMTSLVKWYWGISKSPSIKGYLLGELAEIAKDGNRYAAMEVMADLISTIANEPDIQKAFLSNTSAYTIKANYKNINKTVPTWI